MIFQGQVRRGGGSPRRLFLSPIGTCQTRQLLWIRTETCLLVICQWDHLSIFREKRKKKLVVPTPTHQVRLKPIWKTAMDTAALILLPGEKTSPSSSSSSSTSCFHKFYFVCIVAIHRLLHCTVYQNVRCCDHRWPLFFLHFFFLTLICIFIVHLLSHRTSCVRLKTRTLFSFTRVWKGTDFRHKTQQECHCFCLACLNRCAKRKRKMLAVLFDSGAGGLFSPDAFSECCLYVFCQWKKHRCPNGKLSSCFLTVSVEEKKRVLVFLHTIFGDTIIFCPEKYKPCQ